MLLTLVSPGVNGLPAFTYSKNIATKKKLKKFVNIKNSLNYIDMGIKQCVSNIWWKLSMPFNVFYLIVMAKFS